MEEWLGGGMKRGRENRKVTGGRGGRGRLLDIDSKAAPRPPLQTRGQERWHWLIYNMYKIQHYHQVTITTLMTLKNMM